MANIRRLEMFNVPECRGARLPVRRISAEIVNYGGQCIRGTGCIFRIEACGWRSAAATSPGMRPVVGTLRIINPQLKMNGPSVNPFRNMAFDDLIQQGGESPIIMKTSRIQ